MNTKQITISGVSVELHERTVEQVLALTELSHKIQTESNGNSVLFYQSAVMVLQSLTNYPRSLKDIILHPIKYLQYKRMFTIEYLTKNLTAKELFKHCAAINELEGDDNSFYRLLSKDISEEEARKLIESSKKKHAGNNP